MKSQFQLFKEKFKRNFLKPTIKNLAKYSPSMQSEVLNSQSLRAVFRFVVYAVTFCVLGVSVWTLFPISSSEGTTVTLALSSDLVVKAVYKYAYENPDGTIDLVFNVPRGGETLMRLNNIDLNSSIDAGAGGRITNGTTRDTTTTLAPHPVLSRTVYPISLDSDYVINTISVCPEGQQADYLLLVHSATAYFNRRRTIRETYGGKGLFGNIFQRTVFLLGTTTDPVVTKSIHEEAFIYRDIVQGPFLDSYHNLTHKGVLGFRWAAEHCPQAKIIVKIDDDVFINPFKLTQEVLPQYINKTRHIACHLRPSGTSPIIRGRGKWQVHEDEFRGQKTFPFDYCNGYFVIITKDLIRPLLNAARLNPFFWIDDVYLFGILPATVGHTKFTNIRRNLTLTFENGRKCYEEHGTNCTLVAVSQWIADQSDKLWYMVLSNLTNTVKTKLNVFGLSK